jgi:hypothetical protein
LEPVVRRLALLRRHLALLDHLAHLVAWLHHLVVVVDIPPTVFHRQTREWHLEEEPESLAGHSLAVEAVPLSLSRIVQVLIR